MRDEMEFHFGGPAHVNRPAETVDDATWSQYLFVHENPAGLHLERWLHAYGCGRWFNIARNTLTHEIQVIYAIGDPKPNLKPNDSA